MVVGFAGIFGGQARSAPVSGPKAAAVKQTQTKGVSAFTPTLKAEISAAPASQKHAVIAKSLSARDTYSPSKSAALTLVTGLPPLTAPGNSTSSSGPVDDVPKTAPAVKADSAPSVIDKLKAALVQAGIDISGMQFSQHQDVVTYPGGSYINDLISFQASNGQTHEYMTSLVSIAPQVTVTEIQQLMAGKRG